MRLYKKEGPVRHLFFVVCFASKVLQIKGCCGISAIAKKGTLFFDKNQAQKTTVCHYFFYSKIMYV